MLIAGTALMVIDRTCVAVPPAVSLTLTVKLYVPLVVGVPVIVPVDELSDKKKERDMNNG